MSPPFVAVARSPVEAPRVARVPAVRPAAVQGGRHVVPSQGVHLHQRGRLL